MSPKQILALTGVGCLLASALVSVLGYGFYRRASEPITECEFEETTLVPGLLSEPVTLDRKGRPFFVKWFDGTDVLLMVDEKRTRVLDQELATLHEVDFSGHAERIVSVSHRGEIQWFALYGLESILRTEHLARINSRLEVHSIWTHSGEEDQFSDLDLLFSDEGTPILVASRGGEDSIRGYDLDGRVLWDLHSGHVLKGTSTHPKLPGLFLHSGWDSMLFKHRAQGRPRKISTQGERYYVSGGGLARSLEGEPVVLTLGQDSFDHERVRAYGQAGQNIWEARIPFDPSYMAGIEPQDRVPVMAVLGRFGELIVFDLQCRLLLNTQLPDAGQYTYGLETGVMPDSSWALIATSLKHHFFYRIDVSLLPDASNAAQEK